MMRKSRGTDHVNFFDNQEIGFTNGNTGHPLFEIERQMMGVPENSRKIPENHSRKTDDGCPRKSSQKIFPEIFPENLPGKSPKSPGKSRPENPEARKGKLGD
jgi:hypothetical protein